MPDNVYVTDEIRTALAERRSVVALESTIISHGLPAPVNLETARGAERAIRHAGAVPATVAVIDGQIRVGLTDSELERLARGQVLKSGVRDLPWLVARQLTGATTVAGTIHIARMVGIEIMATGGIGGVHRGATDSGDVSADLIELMRTRVAVVCSGAKAILDLPRTLECLETLGVSIVGYGTNELPAFFSAASGLRLEQRVDSPAEAAALIRSAARIGLDRAVVIANPPPADKALPWTELDQMTARAMRSANDAGVRGKALTPYLLEQLRQLSDGRTMDVNTALIVNNAQLAAEIAVALSSMSRA